MQHTSNKASVILLGYSNFSKPSFKGSPLDFHSTQPQTIVRAIEDKQYKFQEKIVLMGSMNENWGYLRNHILNRSW